MLADGIQTRVGHAACQYAHHPKGGPPGRAVG